LLLDQRGHVKLSDFGLCTLYFPTADTRIALLLLLLLWTCCMQGHQA
jgi:serine/threonine protein kinase